MARDYSKQHFTFTGGGFITEISTVVFTITLPVSRDAVTIFAGKVREGVTL